jgi:DNA-binding transcriptional MerR regulator
MLKISDFSRIAQVPVATLRYYDQLNLLKPARVDPFTDYRYYEITQLPRLNRLLALRDLGFSLDQIGRMLDSTLALDELKGMLSLRQADAEREVAETQARLARVGARLREIEAEGRPSPFDIVVKPVDPLWIASLRQIVPTAEGMGVLCWRLHEQLKHWAGSSGVKLRGLPAPHVLNLYHNTDYTEVDLDLEAAIVIEKPKNGAGASGAPTVHELPGVPMMATGVHRGEPTTIGPLIRALLTWIGVNGYTPAGALREAHLTPRDSDPATGRVIEVQVPVEIGA